MYNRWGVSQSYLDHVSCIQHNQVQNIWRVQRTVFTDKISNWFQQNFTGPRKSDTVHTRPNKHELSTSCPLLWPNCSAIVPTIKGLLLFSSHPQTKIAGKFNLIISLVVPSCVWCYIPTLLWSGWSKCYSGIKLNGWHKKVIN